MRGLFSPQFMISAVVALSTAGGLASAAEISPSNDAMCDILLKGEIEPGDVERLEAVLQKQIVDKEIAEHVLQKERKLCLDSQGGSYDEALRLIEWLTETSNVTTVVNEGAECFSACSLAFMFGNWNEGDNLTGYSRKLHFKGKLGFHTPHVRPVVDSDAAIVTAQAYRAGVRAIGRLLEIDTYDWFPKTLLTAALKIGPDEFLFVDTIAQAAAWNIDLIGLRPPLQVTAAMLESACLNTTRSSRNKWSGRWWGGGDSPTGQREQITAPDRAISLTKKHYRRSFKGFGAEDQYVCVVDVYDAGKRGLLFDVNFGESLRDPDVPKPKNPDLLAKQETFAGTPFWFLYRGDTTLRELIVR